jgi:glycosyltransferase involved in cell wall biosynthesis
MNFKEQIFFSPKLLIDKKADVILVADLFVEDYVGGAELTTDALMQDCPFKFQKLHAKDVNLATLSQGADKFWLFGNFSQLNPELIPSIVANLKYSILEYDYKFCKFRSIEKHQASTGSPCDCADQMNGKLISAFYYGAKAMWWMSESQKDRYIQRFPFLAEKDNFVLSSVFSKSTLGSIKILRETVKEKKGWTVLGSQSWIKGADAAKSWCEKNNKEYEVVWDLKYQELLAKLASSEGFVYLPPGGDTCPRMVIEAKLLGCQLHLNENVQHKDESWFSTDKIEEIEEYLYGAPSLFWNVIKNIMEYKPKISGYTTTYNCVNQQYPFEACITSMLQFCDEVCVVDGGSTDDTHTRLLEIQRKNLLSADGSLEKDEDGFIKNSRVKVKVIKRDWDHPRHAVFDGLQKAEARKMCTGDFCWQMDSDEIVHEDDAAKVEALSQKIPKNVDIISLPVVEYWGGPDKVRIDVQPWKWRLSRNLPHITHGIPAHLKRQDENGDTYSLPGTDGCDMIHRETGEILPHITFHTPESERVRQAALTGHAAALSHYQEWFNSAIQSLPGVHHYSWYDIPRKMRTYRGYWTKHWNSLYNGKLEDTAETNMMFDLPWAEVTEEMIDKRAADLKEMTGGWIWHRKWNGQSIPSIKCRRDEPSLMVKK